MSISNEDVAIINRVLRYRAIKHPELMEFSDILEQIPVDLGFIDGDFPFRMYKYWEAKHPEIDVLDFNRIIAQMLTELGF